ncbi:MAG: CCA tRNA nucleotidyltransferase [Clostridia bacterium]|nr:CCA tRNA nucleotidyltransferase [Clostridia bacterium]
MRIPEAVLDAVAQLNAAGFEAYPVGGCVRDLLSGKQPHDWDLTTSATPDEMLAVFQNDRTVPTGLKHGTLTVIKGDVPLEITTYRVDGNYADGRHPDEVTFTRSLTDDLARRDFTVNAMAWDIKNGVVDPFFGQEDLKKGIIRCVGDADTRFTEDALRILRGLRFASVLGFEIEAKTATAMRRQKERLGLVSAERITEEMTKLLCGKAVDTVLDDYRDILAFFIPEISPTFDLQQQNPHHIHDVFTHTLKAVAAVKAEPELRWAMLLHDIGKAKCFTVDEDGIGHFYGHASISEKMAKDILARFRLSSKQSERILRLIKYHDLPFPNERPMLLKRLHKFGEEICLQLLEMQDADCTAQAPEYRYRLEENQRIRDELQRLCDEQACFSLKDLAVSGDDLLAAGVPAGRTIGKTLERLLTAVMDGRVENTREALLQLVRKEK